MSIFKTITTATVLWGDRQVAMLGLPVGSKLFRVFRHPGADWEAPTKEYRNGRIDPPKGRKAEFSVLYTAGSEFTAGVEARSIRIVEHDGAERPELVEVIDDNPLIPQTVVHSLKAPALFVNLDDRNTAKSIGLDPNLVLDDLEMWRRASLSVWEALATNPPSTIAAVAGICYQSKLRASNGWNFGFFHGRHEALLGRGKPRRFSLPPI